MTIISTIIEQHTEDAAFLWLQRDAVVHKSHYNLNRLAKLDDRVEAHIDGLRIAGDTGWEICKQALELEEPGEAFAASVLAFEGGDAQRIETVITAGAASYDTWRGLVSAFGWLPQEQINNLLPGLFKSEETEFRRLGISATAIHRQDSGAELNEALEDPDPLFLARALRAAGELKRRDLLSELQKFFQSEDEKIRFWAAWSALLLGDQRALEILQLFTINESTLQEKAIQLAFRNIDSKQILTNFSELASMPGDLRYTITAAGVVGDPVRIPWLIEQMSQPELSRVAGESFSMITGVDIAHENLEGEWPEGFEAGPTEDPEDGDVEMDSDEDLPWPNPERVADWWSKNKGDFKNGNRYLVGKPITEEQCQHVLRYGYQRQRAAAALELAIMNPNEPLFNVCAPGFRQKQILRLK